MESADAQNHHDHSKASDGLQLLRCEDHVLAIVYAEG
jgi:hypothetical protein